jgi:hypothetical protein
VKHVPTILWSLSFWAFVAIKVAGTSLAAWSWWWILIPPIPVVGLFVARYGL